MNESNLIDGVDYGPLANMVGVWKGDKGLDVAPKVQGEEKSPYYETLMFEAIGSVTNAGEQTLSVLRYHQVVSRHSDKQVFHNETGYWMWDPKEQRVMQSLTIPRGVCLLAGGGFRKGEPAGVLLEVKAAANDEHWSILQSPFMQAKAKTLEFDHKITVDGDALRYEETMVLDIYGRRFEHRDENELIRSK